MLERDEYKVHDSSQESSQLHLRNSTKVPKENRPLHWNLKREG